LPAEPPAAAPPAAPSATPAPRCARWGAGRVLETHLTFAGIIGGPCLTARGLACTWFTVVPKSPRLAGLSSSILLREAARSCSTVRPALRPAACARA